MDYRKLKGRIKEVYDRHEDFAVALGISPTSLSLKLNNKREWTSGEIATACNLLNVPLTEAHLYFFRVKV